MADDKSKRTESKTRTKHEVTTSPNAAKAAHLPEPTAPLPVIRPAAKLPLKPTEIKNLFPDEEVGRLKLAVLTSADPSARITAIRQLVLAPGSPEEKGGVLLSALADDSPQVRLEVIKALVPLGLNPELAHEARLLVSGTAKQKIAAAARIGLIAEQAGAGEVSVLIALVAASLRADLPDDARKELVQSLGPAAETLAAHAELLAATVNLLAEQLVEQPALLAAPVSSVIAELGVAAPKRTSELLADEAAHQKDPQARRLLLGAFCNIDVPPQMRIELAKLMVDELAAAPEPETQCLGIANSLSRWGHQIAPILIEAAKRSARQQRAFMLRLIDSIASQSNCPAPIKRAAAEVFLSLLNTSKPAGQAVLIESEIFADPVLPAKTRAAAAQELITRVHEFGSPRMLDIIEHTLVRIGAPALEPLVDTLKSGVRDRERIFAARTLGNIVSKMHGAKKDAERALGALMTCIKLLDADFPGKNVLAASIGQMCTGRLIPTDSVRRVARGLRVRVGKEPYSFGLLDGLGRLAASPSVELRTRVEIAESLLSLLEVELPEMQSKRYEGGEKTVFIAGREAAAYTDLMPILLDGLRNVCVHAGSLALRDRIISSLTQKWREVASWRVVWGPANMLKLAETLGAIAFAPNATPEIRFDIARALASTSDLTPVLKVLGKICAADTDLDELGALAARVGEHLLERLAPESRERIELDASAMGALAAIAGRKDLGAPDRAKRLRNAVARVLYKANRRGSPEARAALEQLARAPGIDKKLAAEIKARLG